MGYYDSVLRALPTAAFRLNSAATSYSDISGHGETMSGTLALSSSILAGEQKSISVTGGTANYISTNVFKKGNESQPFSLVAWVAPMTFQIGTLSILSHNNIYDGLIFDGDFIKFRIKSSLNNFLEVSWPVPDISNSYMVVGVYSNQKIQLYINGQVVSEATLIPEFLTWATEPSSNLYLGQSSTAYRATADGLATYAVALTSNQILDMYLQGRDVIPTESIVNAFGGSYWTGTDRAVVLTRTWAGDLWNNGTIISCSAIDGSLRPQNDITTGLSMPGSWIGMFELSSTEDTSIGGVKIEWDGDGTFTVATSINSGTTWITATNARNITGTYTLNTTGKDMLVRVTFAGGIASDRSVVRSLKLTAFSDPIVNGPDTSRTIALNDLVTTGTQFEQPIERGMSSGINYYGGSSTLSVDATSTPRNIYAMEFWIRPQSGALSGTGGYVFDTRGYGGTAYMWIVVASQVLGFAGHSAVYVNGVSVSNGVSIKYNEWTHVLFVFSTPFNTAVAIGGGQYDGSISLITTYSNTFTAAQAMNLFQSYSRYPLLRVDDPGVITIFEPAVSVKAYSYDWDFQGV